MITPISLNHLPEGEQLHIYEFLNGVDLPNLQKAAKNLYNFIKKHENELFHDRMEREYPGTYLRYAIPNFKRIDWKNIYVITDQYQVALDRAKHHEGVLKCTNRVEVASYFMFYAELVIHAVSITIGAAKISVMRCEGDEIRSWRDKNPGSSFNDAFNALHPRPETDNQKQF